LGHDVIIRQVWEKVKNGVDRYDGLDRLDRWDGLDRCDRLDRS
jgi:hypothetical protein